MSQVEISTVTEVDDRLVRTFERLIPQLSRSSPPPTIAELQSVVASPSCHLLIASDDEEILGTLTLVVFPIPTALRAWIEDVVVDDAARGRGVASKLNLYAIDLAHQLGAKTIDLTSRPSRETANRMYKRLGFVARDTNVYRYEQMP